MGLYPSQKKKNLEKTGKDVHAGPWRISTLFDPIREKKFLLFGISVKSIAPFAPSILPFRCDAAALIAPAHCLPITDVAIDSDRVELVTEWIECPAFETLEDADLAALFEIAVRSIAEFEAGRFYVERLFWVSIIKIIRIFQGREQALPES